MEYIVFISLREQLDIFQGSVRRVTLPMTPVLWKHAINNPKTLISKIGFWQSDIS
jgi:hypothetical protein